MAQPRGRKPRPKNLHIVKGTDTRSRHGGEEAEPGGEIGPAPEHLGETARDFWEWARAQLDEMGTGSEADRVDLEYMAILYERAREAEKVSPAGGFFLDNDKLPKRHPAAIEASQCRKELRLMLESMGLSAIGRARHRTPATPETDDRAPAGQGPYQRPTFKASS